MIGLDEIVSHIKKNNLGSLEKDIYEFGVCTGGGTSEFLEKFEEIEYRHYFGFDSLEGLPKEMPGLRCPTNWREGAFNAWSTLGLKNKEEAENYLKNKFKDYNFDLIVGFYDKVLNKELVQSKKFKPALFISMDVDLYISCYQALDWMFQNKLIILGTIIRYDDWLANIETAGECLAHKEICQKYNVDFEFLVKEETVVVVIK